MKNIKGAIQALKDFKQSSDVTLFCYGTQSLHDSSQETAVEKTYYDKEAINYLITKDDRHYVLDVKNIEEKSEYSAMEDEWVHDVTKTREETIYSLIPLYLKDYEQERYEGIEELTETYVENHLTGESNVPAAIKTLAEELAVLAEQRSNSPIDNEFDLMLAEMDNDKRREDPNAYVPQSIRPLTLQTQTTFDLEFRTDGFDSLFKGYKVDELKLSHQAHFPKHNKIIAMEEAGVELDDVLALNRIANQSGKPIAFLNKLDKYSAEEANEMFYMMKSTQKIVDIFSKDLESFEVEDPKVENKRNRRNRPR